MQVNRIDLSEIKRNEPFCSLDLTRYFITAKKFSLPKREMDKIPKKKAEFLKQVLGHGRENSNVGQVSCHDQLHIESDFKDNASVSSVR